MYSSFVGLNEKPFSITPDPTDGVAEVLVSFAVGHAERLAYAVRLKRGTHDERTDVRVHEATTIRVSGESFWCNADGELIGPFRSRTWTVHSSAFRMFLRERT